MARGSRTSGGVDVSCGNRDWRDRLPNPAAAIGSCSDTRSDWLHRGDLLRPLLAHPDDETEESFVAWARAHYRARAKELNVNAIAAGPQRSRDAAWYVGRVILGVTLSERADRHDVGPDEISKHVKEFADLVGATIDRSRGRSSG